MVTEYLLLLVISAVILALSFGIDAGPVTMFKQKTPVLACLMQQNLATGDSFRPKSQIWEDDSSKAKAPGTGACS